MTTETAVLIGGGSLVGLFVVYKLAKAHATVPVATGTGTGTSVVPGSSGGGTGSSSTSLLGKFYNADKQVLGTTYSAVKSIVTLGGLL